QRLTASKEGARPRRRFCTSRSGSAQRLTASKEGALAHRLPAGQVVDLLNALRHRRNAHKWFDQGKLVGFRCSTPYGIEGTRRASSITERCRGIAVVLYTHQP